MPELGDTLGVAHWLIERDEMLPIAEVRHWSSRFTSPNLFYSGRTPGGRTSSLAGSVLRSRSRRVQPRDRRPESGTGRGERSDAVLLREAGADPAAFSELYRRHVGAVYEWLARRIAWAASDLTAETFARAWLIRHTFVDEREGSVLPWLLGIAANLLADAARHDRIETRARERLGLPVDLVNDDGYTEVEQRLSPRLALERQVKALAPHERDALELRVVAELSYEQVAQRLAIRPAAARLRVSRALRRLAQSVPKEEA